MTLLLSELEEQVSERHSVLLSLALKQLAFQNFSPQDHILWLLREVLMLLLEICMKMIGDGISMIQLKELIGLEIKMQFIT